MTSKRFFRAFIVLAMVLASLLVRPLAANAGVVGPVQIVNLRSRLCLAIPNALPDDEVQLVQWNCEPSGHPEQKWQFESEGADQWGYPLWQIRNPTDSKCAVVQAGSMAPGAKIIQYGCNQSTNSLWTTLPWGPGTDLRDYYYLINYKSNLCLVVRDASKVAGVGLVQDECDSTVFNGLWTWY